MSREILSHSTQERAFTLNPTCSRMISMLIMTPRDGWQFNKDVFQYYNLPPPRALVNGIEVGGRRGVPPTG